jgi:DNA repair protein RadB
VKKGGHIYYIDTEGGLSPERMKQIAGGDSEKFLKEIKIFNPKSYTDQSKVIRDIEKLKGGMIIVDSVVALYRLECADPKKETHNANKELSIQLSVLSNIARERNSPVIITSHVYKDRDSGESHVIGGDTIKYWSKSMVLIEATGKTGERKATIIKHRSIPEGGTVKFEITETGMKPASGFKIF